MLLYLGREAQICITFGHHLQIKCQLYTVFGAPAEDYSRNPFHRFLDGDCAEKKRRKDLFPAKKGLFETKEGRKDGLDKFYFEQNRRCAMEVERPRPSEQHVLLRGQMGCRTGNGEKLNHS